MCELGQSSPLVRYSRQNLWAEAATAHVLLGGPRLNVLRQKWVFYYPIEKIRSSADIDASHFTTACEASIWPHTYKNGILPPGLVRAPVEAVAVRGEVPRDTGAERDLPRPSYPIPSLTMHSHDRIVNDAHARMLIVRFAHPPPAQRRALLYPICKTIYFFGSFLMKTKVPRVPKFALFWGDVRPIAPAFQCKKMHFLNLYTFVGISI